MEDKLFGIDVKNLYNYDLENAYNFVKENTDYLNNISIDGVKNINFSVLKDIIILLCDGNVIVNGKKSLNNIEALASMSGLSIYAISKTHVITCLTDDDEVSNFINNDNCEYRKILFTPSVIVALTTYGDIRLVGTLCNKVVDYNLYFDLDDIGYVWENEDIVVMKIGKVFSLFHQHDYSNEIPDVLVEGSLDDLEIIGE